MRIDRDAAPFEHAQVAREHQRALLGRRRERTFVAQTLEDHAAHQLVIQGRAPHILVRKILLRTVGQLGVRLRRRNVIAFRGALRNRGLRRRHDRLTGTAIQHKDVAGFRRGVDHRNGIAVFIGDVGQRRLRRQIHVPQIVMHGLIRPHQLTGGGVQRQHAARVALLLRRAVAAPDIRGRNAHRQVNGIQFRIVDRRRPGVRRVHGEGVFISRNRVRIFRARIEDPQQFTGIDVEAANYARRLARRVVIGYRARHNDGGIGDNRRRRRLILARRGDRLLVLQIQLAVVAEGRAARTGVRIQREQTAVVYRQVNTARAERRLAVSGIGRRRHFVVRDATAGDMLEGRIRLHARIEFPLLLAGGRVEREQNLVRRAEVDRVADLNRRHFVGNFARIVRGLEIAGLELPGNLQVFHVLFVDLLQRRETRTLLIARIGGPVGVGDIAQRLRWRSVLRGFRQLAVHRLRIVEHRIGQHQGAGNQRDGHAAQRGFAAGVYATVNKRQDQPDAENHQHIGAWRQGPEVSADFPHAPDQGANQQQRIENQRGAFAT